MALQIGDEIGPEPIVFSNDLSKSNDFFDEATKKALNINKGDLTLYR